MNPDTHRFQNVYDFHATDETSNFIQDGIYLVRKLIQKLAMKFKLNLSANDQYIAQEKL